MHRINKKCPLDILFASVSKDKFDGILPSVGGGGDWGVPL